MSDNTITISKSEYRQLLKVEARMQLMEEGGVDNWQWIHESLYGDHLDQDLEQLEEAIDKEYADE